MQKAVLAWFREPRMRARKIINSAHIDHKHNTRAPARRHEAAGMAAPAGLAVRARFPQSTQLLQASCTALQV